MLESIKVIFGYIQLHEASTNFSHKFYPIFLNCFFKGMVLVNVILPETPCVSSLDLGGDNDLLSCNLMNIVIHPAITTTLIIPFEW